MAVGFNFYPAEGHNLARHPENVQRMHGIWELLSQSDVLARVQQWQPEMATVEQLARVHSAEHIRLVEVSAETGVRNIGSDTYLTPDSYRAARYAAGSACQAVQKIAEGAVDRAIVLARPPGHHAGSESVEGFCLFNNIAIAAREAQSLGFGKIAIVDFDVHHGNGTQQIFYDDKTVQFFSTHMFANYFYPGSGYYDEDGVKQGKGMTINVPLPPGVGDSGYATIFDSLIDPLIGDFGPDMLLVSIGFDAHWRDQLAQMGLSLTGYAKLVRKLIGMADRYCQGKIGFVLEGGYDIEVLAYGVLNLFYAILDEEMVRDPIGISAEPEPDVSDLIHKLQQFHLLC